MLYKYLYIEQIAQMLW